MLFLVARQAANLQKRQPPLLAPNRAGSGVYCADGPIEREKAYSPQTFRKNLRNVPAVDARFHPTWLRAFFLRPIPDNEE